MEHLFLNKELSLLAKEKGFDEPCLACYFDNYAGYNEKHPPVWKFLFLDSPNKERNSKYKDSEMSAPLYQQIIDWFREKHKVFIRIDIVDSRPAYSPFIFLEKQSYDWTSVWAGNYYEALDKAIEEAFKLI